jgi:hypothetical protein
MLAPKENPTDASPIDQPVAWLGKGVGVRNCAGNRESKAPGIGGRTERFLARVFKRLAAEGMVERGEP